MKLAEALAERSDCQIRIEELKKRLNRSARVQEGDQPAEDTAELLVESERVFARMLELVSAINPGAHHFRRDLAGTLDHSGLAVDNARCFATAQCATRSVHCRVK